MLLLPRIVWQDGMHLAQHHFQQQARHVESTIHFALSSAHSYCYGLATLAIDRDALANGELVVRQATGVLPDGLPLHIPTDSGEALSIRLESHFPPTATVCVFSIAVPSESASTAGSRYRAFVRVLADETTGGDSRNVVLGAPAWRLVAAGEGAGLTSLPVARVIRDGQGRFALDDRFIPPCIRLGASDRLVRLRSAIEDLLRAKSDEIRRRQGASAAALRDHAAGEIASFWLLHTVNSALGTVLHMGRALDTHPEQLFLELVKLAGGLCTFSLQADAASLPSYKHEDLADSFDALERAISLRLSDIMPADAVRLPFKRRSNPLLHTVKLTDPRVFRAERWYLEIRSRESERERTHLVPRSVKIAADMEQLNRMVEHALPGPQLRHTDSPPAGLSPRDGASYFIIEPGAMIAEFERSKALAAYAPDSLSDVSITLCIVLEA